MDVDHLFTIRQVSTLIGLRPSTLRFWEKEFEGILAPVRTTGGQRRYRAEDLTVIKRIKQMREEGATISGIKRNLVKGEKGDYPDPGRINLLADKVAEVVKAEIFHFLTTEKETA
jgi:DNA-binding transcriptional MerR regulator